MNKIQWNINRISYIFIQENAFEYVVCKMSDILFWPKCYEIDHNVTWHTVPLHMFQVDPRDLPGTSNGFRIHRQ